MLIYRQPELHSLVQCFCHGYFSWWQLNVIVQIFKTISTYFSGWFLDILFLVTVSAVDKLGTYAGNILVHSHVIFFIFRATLCATCWYIIPMIHVYFGEISEAIHFRLTKYFFYISLIFVC